MKKAFIQLHIAILLAGFTAILGKLISLDAVPLVWWRLAITVVAMSGYLLFANKKAYPKKDLASVLGIGALVGLHWVCFFGSVKFANVSIALVCFSASGFFCSLFEPLLLKKRFSPFQSGLGLLSMAGIYVIFHFDARYKLGIALGVAGAMLSALFSILNKQFITKMDGVAMTAYEMIGALAMISIVLPFTLYQGGAFWPEKIDWLWLLILALLCTVWAYVLQLYALRHISAFTLNISYNLEPVYGIILAFVVFQENKNLSPVFYVGLGLIIIAITAEMYSLKRKRLQPIA